MKDKIHVLNYINSLTEEQKGQLLFNLLDYAQISEWVNWYYDEDEDPKFRIYWKNSGEDLI